MSAYLEGQNTVTPKHVKYAMNHLDGSEQEGTLRRRSFALYASIIGAAFALTLLIGYMLTQPKGDEAASNNNAPASVSAQTNPADQGEEGPAPAKGKAKKQLVD